MSFISESQLSNYRVGSKSFSRDDIVTLNERYSGRTDKPTIFLSHKHDEYSILQNVISFLKNEGVDVYVDWMDEEIYSLPVVGPDPFLCISYRLRLFIRQVYQLRLLWRLPANNATYFFYKRYCSLASHLVAHCRSKIYSAFFFAEGRRSAHHYFFAVYSRIAVVCFKIFAAGRLFGNEERQ